MRRIRLLLPLVVFLLAVAVLIPSARSSSAHDKARLDAAAKVYPAMRARYEQGTVDVDTVYTWSARWLDAERAVSGSTAATKAHLARMKALESAVSSRVQTGMAPATDGLAAVYYRAEAEAWAASPLR